MLLASAALDHRVRPRDCFCAGPVLTDFDILLDDAAGGMIPSMPSWSDSEAAVPELAARVRERLDAHRHKTIATIRADGAPRISGIEAQVEGGELWIGSDRDALKARDLLRDPRFALHSGSDDPPADRGQASSWAGDAKLAGSSRLQAWRSSRSPPLRLRRPPSPGGTGDRLRPEYRVGRLRSTAGRAEGADHDGGR